MKNILSIILLTIIIIFFFWIFKYYLSSKNIQNINSNRMNIETIIDKKIANIPVLTNDTNNIIEFNSSYQKNFQEDQPRKFWDLFKK